MANKETFLNRLVKYRMFLIMLIPALVYTVIFAYLPMAGIVMAFKKYNYVDGIFKSPWNGFKNFEFFFQSGKALLVTKNTVLYNILFIVFNTALQMAVAILLVEMKNRHFRKITQSVMFLPYFISWVIVSVLAFNILSYDFGFLNSIIHALGGEKINFYADGKLWPFILTFFGAWKG